VIAGMLGARNTSHLRMYLELCVRSCVLLSDCPCIERAWSARIGQVEAVTRAIRGHSIGTPVLKSLWAFQIACIFAPFLKAPRLKVQNAKGKSFRRTI